MLLHMLCAMTVLEENYIYWYIINECYSYFGKFNGSYVWGQKVQMAYILDGKRHGIHRTRNVILSLQCPHKLQ